MTQCDTSLSVAKTVVLKHVIIHTCPSYVLLKERGRGRVGEGEGGREREEEGGRGRFGCGQGMGWFSHAKMY